MGILHIKTGGNRQFGRSLAIIVPPKCGTTIASQLATFPEYEGRVYEDSKQDLEDRDYRVFMVRDHHSRVLSTYLDKIVINDPSEWANGNGWRAKGHTSPPTERYGDEMAWFNFRAYAANLGTCHWWDGHIKPYLSQPTFASHFWKSLTSNRKGAAVWATPKSWTTGSILGIVNDFLGLPDGTCNERLQEVLEQTRKHKINYSNDMPSPEDYQPRAKSWGEVHRENLYRCFLETGKVPSAELMYERMSTTAVAAQLAYVLDDHEIRRAGGPSVSMDIEAALDKFGIL